MKQQLRRVCLAAALASILNAPQSTAQPPDDQAFVVSFDETALGDVIESVSLATGRSIISDARIAVQTITFHNQQPMTQDELWAAFLEMLQVYQYAAIESVNGRWRIMPEANARTEGGEYASPTGAEYQTATITVNNLQAAQMVPILRPLVGTAGQLASPPNTNQIVLVDRAANVERILRVVEELDRANAQEVSVVQLQYASAEDVTDKVTQVAQAQSGGSVAMLQAIPDERTNRVILTGTPAQLEYFRGVAESLDLPSLQGSGSQVRYLFYADAEEVAEILQNQFGGSQVVEDAETAADVTGGNVSVLAHVGTNSLVINAPSRVQQEILSIIDSLDIARAQVHIQAIIVEMSAARAAEFGMTWALDGASGDEAAALTNYSNIGGGILQLAQIGAGGVPDPSAIGSGITAAVGSLSDSGTSWAAILSALQGDAQTNVMQFPELVVLDNEEALITVGQQVPFRTGEYANAGNQGAVNPFSTIQREDVGTSLTITPRINEGTGMRLTIAQELSSVSESAIASDVITNERRIETEVFVTDGDILVLGGLVDDQLRENEQRVPGLGRIPGFKWLFSGRNTDRTKSSLMVFIRPTILRDSAAASQMTNSRYRALQNEQNEQAGEPVQLMRDADRPTLPPLDESGNTQ